MKILAINGSPRVSGNTGTLLKSALEYASKKGHETEFIQLSELNYRGCRSCLVCKLDKEPYRSSPACVLKDDLTDVLETARNSDILLLGSPIYFGSLASDMYAFFERLWFPALVYDKSYSTLIKKPIPSGLIITMNMKNDEFYKNLLNNITSYHGAKIGPTELLTVTDTCQFSDYSKYVCEIFDHNQKESRRLNPGSEIFKSVEEFVDKLIKSVD